MGTGEIKSPEVIPERKTPPSARDGNSVSETVQRKKLGIYFIESDNRRLAFGRGYTGGTTPVNIKGKPIKEADLSKTGGWIAAFFIFGNEMAERMAYFGLSVNMVAFMFYVMHRPFSSSSNAVNNFLGISQASSVLGGFLADAYLGRYKTIAIFTTIYLVVRKFIQTHTIFCPIFLLKLFFSFTGGFDRDNTMCIVGRFCTEPRTMRSARYTSRQLRTSKAMADALPLHSPLHNWLWGSRNTPLRFVLRSGSVRRKKRRLQDPSGQILQFLLPFSHHWSHCSLHFSSLYSDGEGLGLCLWLISHSYGDIKSLILRRYSFVPPQIARRQPVDTSCPGSGCCI